MEPVDNRRSFLKKCSMIGALSLSGVIGESKKSAFAFPVGKNSENEEPFNVKKFGAKGNGSKNDTVAIQKAFNEATTGCSVFFPKGEYLVSGSIQIKNHNVTVFGEGAASILAPIKKFEGPLLKSIGRDNITVHSMHLTGNLLVSHVLWFEKSNFVNVYNNLIRAAHPYHGITFINGTRNSRIESNFVMDNGGDGICVLQDCSDIIISNNVAINNQGVNIELEGRDGLTPKPNFNCLIQSNICHGKGSGHSKIGDHAVLSIFGNHIVISSNIISSTNTNGLKVIGSKNVSIIGNSIDGFLSKTQGHGILIEKEIFKNGRSKNITLMGNTIANNRIGFKVADASNVNIFGNSFGNNLEKDIFKNKNVNKIFFGFSEKDLLKKK